MGVVVESQSPHVRRMLLLALFASILWCAITLLTFVPSASADENDRGSGLLGAVGSVVTGVADVVTETTAVVDEVVTETVQTVAPVAAPVAEPLPAPVAAPVTQVVATSTAAVGGIVAHTDDTVTDVVNQATSAVSAVASRSVVSEVVATVVDLATEVPLAGGVVERVRLDVTLTGLAGGLDKTLSGVVGQAPKPPSLLPDLPVAGVGPVVDFLSPQILPSTPGGPLPSGAAVTAAVPAPAASAPTPRAAAAPPLSAGGSAATAEALTAAAIPEAVATSSSPGDRGWGGVGSLSAGQTSATGSAGGAVGTAATSDARAWALAADPSRFRVHTDDALPGSPVLDTDVAPD